MWNKRQAGVTLVELIIAIIIIGIAVSGVLQIFNIGAVASADPIVTKQLRAVAEGMMDEIQRQPFAAAANIGTPSNACARDTFNDVMDYNGYAPGYICLITGEAVAALSGMAITVNISSQGYLGLAAGDEYYITVTTTKAGNSFTLHGWRANFAKGVTE